MSRKDAVRAVQSTLGTKQNKIEWKSATLGDGHGTVSTGNNMVYCRLSENSSVIEVLNLRVMPVDGLRVRIAKTPEMPLVWQVIGQEDQRVDENGALVGSSINYNVGLHGANHGYLGADQISIDWRQISSLRVYAYSGFTIGVLAGLIPRPGADLVVESQTLDLTSYIPVSGALYCLISVDSVGALAATVGATVASRIDLTLADIPDTPNGNFRLAAVRLFSDQVSISETRSANDIRDLRWPQERLAGDVYGQFGVQTAGYVLAGPETGSPANPTFRALIEDDLPATSAFTRHIDPETPLHFTDTAIAADRYDMERNYTTAAQALVTKLSTPTGVLASFEFDATGADFISEGLFRVTFWANALLPSGIPPDGKTHLPQTATITDVELIRKDSGATETVICTTATNTTPLIGTLTRYQYIVAVPDTDIIAGDTLIVRFNISVTTVPDTLTVGYYDPDVSIGVYGDTFSRADIPLRFTVYTLARLDAYNTFDLGAVFNETGADSDFRVESDTESNMLLIDASADKAYIGGTTNGIEISKGGTLKLLGTATTWQDIDFPILIRTTGANIPTLTTLNGNLTMPQWAVNDYNVCESQEFVHQWKEGSTCYWHIHLTTNGLDASDRYVRFELEYGYVDSTGVWTFPATADSGDLLIPASTTSKTQIIFSIANFTPTGSKIGHHAIARLKRIAASGTAPSNNPWVPMLQMHVECDTIGSNTIDQK